MYLHASDFKNFYKTNLGKIVKNEINFFLKKYASVYSDQIFSTFGYFQNDLSRNGIKFLNFFDNRHGVIKNIIEEKESKNILVNQEYLPIEDSALNHILAIHYLEYSNNIRLSLNELWRVLAPEGTAYFLLPNKFSFWSIKNISPFSNGLSFSKLTIENFLNLNNFDIQFIERLIYFPPTNSNFLQKKNLLFNKFGPTLWKNFNGLYMIVAKKRVYSRLSKQKNKIFSRKAELSRI